jgi:hypothetical protein
MAIFSREIKIDLIIKKYEPEGGWENPMREIESREQEKMVISEEIKLLNLSIKEALQKLVDLLF